MNQLDQRDKIAILGFGIEGKAMLDYLIKHGYPNVTVCDENVDLEAEMPDGVSVRLGKDYLKDLTDFDVVFRSPGIRYLKPEIQVAKNNGVNVTSSTEFFMTNCPCPIVGVTGTKGKGTTCTLIFNILKKAGKSVYLGGNIGKSPMSFLDKLKGKDLVVLELSSFQLQGLDVSPKYAVLLNTTSDHLDYHVDKGEYLQAKEGLLAHQKKESLAILNKDYEYVEYYLPLVKGEKRLVSVSEKVKDGAYEEDDVLYFCENGKSEELMKVKDVGLIGAHNLENVLPAIVIGKELGVKSKDIVAEVKKFKGLKHRLQLVKEVKGVRFYDDSISTTPETSMAAVDSFNEETVLIAGGSDKGLEYDEWALKILSKPSLKTVILIGDLADKMEKEIVEAEEKLGAAAGSPTQVLKRDDLQEAVVTGFMEAAEGGVVVLSPAAASFDMFKDYKDRGEQFVKFVEGLE